MKTIQPRQIPKKYNNLSRQHTQKIEKQMRESYGNDLIENDERKQVSRAAEVLDRFIKNEIQITNMKVLKVAQLKVLATYFNVCSSGTKSELIEIVKVPIQEFMNESSESNQSS